MGHSIVLELGVCALLTAALTVDSPDRPESPMTRTGQATPTQPEVPPLHDTWGIAHSLSSAPLSESDRQKVAASIVSSGQKYGLDPRLIVAVIHAESSFNPRAVSPVGAIGLMQVMPETGRYWLSLRGEKLRAPHKLFDPELNIDIGVSYLAAQIRTFGSLEGGLTAYNAGPAAARRILQSPASRARFLAGYPRKVVDTYRRLRRSTARILARNLDGNVDNKT